MVAKGPPERVIFMPTSRSRLHRMKRKPTAARARRRSIAAADFPPLTTKELAKLRPVALVKAVRWGLVVAGGL